MTAPDEKAARSLAAFLKEIGPSAALETWLGGYDNVKAKAAYAQKGRRPILSIISSQLYDFLTKAVGSQSRVVLREPWLLHCFGGVNKPTH
jgi:hypothetical protein